jgi:hypothetical protein
MVKMDGDKTYDKLKAKVEAEVPLTKQDLMSVVFLPLMKSRHDKITRIEQAITLSNNLKDTDEQQQIQAMLHLLADKFIKDANVLERLKGMMRMSIIIESIVQDERLGIAKNMIDDGVGVSTIVKYTGLSESAVRELQAEINAKQSY